MVQNMNNIQYALMLAGGLQRIPVRKKYQLPANSLMGEICYRHTDMGKISVDKMSLGIPVGDIGDSIYNTRRDAVKNSPLPRQQTRFIECRRWTRQPFHLLKSVVRR